MTAQTSEASHSPYPPAGPALFLVLLRSAMLVARENKLTLGRRGVPATGYQC